jgi:hypothetical protein
VQGPAGTYAPARVYQLQTLHVPDNARSQHRTRHVDAAHRIKYTAGAPQVQWYPYCYGGVCVTVCIPGQTNQHPGLDRGRWSAGRVYILGPQPSKPPVPDCQLRSKDADFPVRGEQARAAAAGVYRHF